MVIFKRWKKIFKLFRKKSFGILKEFYLTDFTILMKILFFGILQKKF